MSIEDLKLGIFNAITLGISFTHVENSLKVILLLLSIGYTAQKIYETYKKKDSNAKNK
jgi:hypothetical protein